MSIYFRPMPDGGNRFYDRYTDPGEVRATMEHRDLTFAPDRGLSVADDGPAPDDDYCAPRVPLSRKLRGTEEARYLEPTDD